MAAIMASISCAAKSEVQQEEPANLKKKVKHVL